MERAVDMDTSEVVRQLSELPGGRGWGPLPWRNVLNPDFALGAMSPKRSAGSANTWTTIGAVPAAAHLFEGRN